MRVLVTRPEPGASRTAALLRKRGHVPVVLPMTRFVDIPVDSAVLNSAGAYAVTSAQALRSWQALGIAAACLEQPLYAVGDRTAQVAGDAGFADVRPGGGGGKELAAKILADINSGKVRISQTLPLLYAVGRSRHSGFENALAAQRVPLKIVELYDIEQISYPTDLLDRMFLHENPDAVLLYSAMSAQAFFHQLEEHGLFNLLKDCQFICMSGQVSQAVPAGFSAQTLVSQQPDEESLLKILERTGQEF